MTNREWLQSLTDEELAEALTFITNDHHSYCPYVPYETDCFVKGCNKGREEWLQAEYKGDYQ